MHLRALIFDLDGVIADTISLHYESWVRLGQDYNIPFTLEDYEPMLGLPRRACLDLFLKGRTVSEDLAQTMMARKNAYFHELLDRLTPADAAPGVADLIREGRAAGLKIALGSSSQNARLVLKKVGLLEYFDVIGDGLTVERTKPAPDIYLWVADRLHLPPHEGVVFEDSGAGVQAALAGGFRVVGLGAARVVGAAHVVLPSLAGVTLDRLRDLLARAKAQP
ncbi:MAG: beta-phosphoglucomutase family hydrolase [Chloroflexi bacterium]|nr:beta-phosphoglucomutase family hydrolase [Chloroflexota bacterium]